MCLIVDANVLGEFFTNDDFSIACAWIREGKGKLVFGGTKYRAELARVGPALRVVVELNRIGKTVQLADSSVDAREAEIAARSDLESDDPHIIAMVQESGCCVVCTKDRALQKDFSKRFRQRFGIKKPSVYKDKRHRRLICPDNIVPACR